MLLSLLGNSLNLDCTSAVYADGAGVKSVSLAGGTPHPFFDNEAAKQLRLPVDDTHLLQLLHSNGEQAILRAPKYSARLR